MSAVEAGITVGGLAGLVAGGKIGYSIAGWWGTLLVGPLGLILGAVAGVALLMQVIRLGGWWSERREYRRLSPPRQSHDEPSRWPRFCCRLLKDRYYKRFWLLMTEVVLILILIRLAGGGYAELRDARWIDVVARSAMVGAMGYLLVIFDMAVMRYYRRHERFYKRHRK